MVEVVWRKGALLHLEKHYRFIKKDSLQSADKVRTVILDMTDDLKNNPEIHPLDKYRKNNNGDIRAFEKYNLRVSYQVTEREIRIIRLRHSSRDPVVY